MSKRLDNQDGSFCHPSRTVPPAKKWRQPPDPRKKSVIGELSDMDESNCDPALTSAKKWKPPQGNTTDKPNFDLPPAPHPRIECFRNDPWAEHPLLRYDSLAEKKQLDNEVVIRRGKKVKNAVANVVYRNMKTECGQKVKDDNDDLEAFLTQDDFDEYRRDSVKSAPVVPIQKSWLRHIAAMVPKELKKRNLPLFRALIKEVEERYEMVLHESILNFVLVPPSGYVDPYLLVIKYPTFSTAPPPWWETFRINRHIIAQQLRMLYPIVSKTFLKMRSLMNTYKLFDPSKLEPGLSTYLRPEELKDAIINQITTNGDMFLQKFIPQLVRIFQNPKALKGLSESKQELIMECASHMIVSDATSWAMSTIQEIVRAYENYTQFLPRILVDTAIEDGKVTFAPPVEGWLYCFKKIVDEIVGVIQNIPDVAELFWGRFEQDKSVKVFCKISIPNFLVEHMTERFRSVMDVWLVDVQSVAERIYDKYKPLLDGTVKAELLTFIASEEKTFYDGFKYSASLKEWGQSMYEIPKNEFIGWIQVNNEDVIGRLLDICKAHQTIISDYLTKWLRAHNYAIIMGYKDIRDRLLTKPSTTAELMELVEYIDEARGVLLLLLKEDVIESLKMCLAYMDYYLLSADDMELAITAQKLLKKIQPAFEKSAIMIEDQKALFEEQLHQKVKDMKEDLAKLLRRVKEDFGRYGDYNEVGNYCDDLRFVTRRVELLQEGIDWINTEEGLFKFNPTEFGDMEEIKNHLDPYTRLFETTRQWQRAEKKYMKGDFDLDAPEIDKETQGYFNELTELQALFKSRIKAEKELEAKEKHIPVSLLYDEDNLTEIPPPLKICMEALDSLIKFRTNLPAMMILCNPAMRQRHWEQMSEFSGLGMVPDTGSSLKKLLEKGLDPFMEEFEEISFCATQELELATTIGDMKETWEHEKIDSAPYKDTETTVLQGAEEIQYLLKQNIVETQILKGSRFVTPHKDTVVDWEAVLLRAQAAMEEWTKVQGRWTYLEHMFSSEDIAALLPDEAAYFSVVDEIWRNIMQELEGQTTALEMAKKPGLLEKLLQCTALLDKVLKGLNTYLEERRVSFPRLFFLTNEETVEILAETKDANKIQPFLSKLFEGISELRIDSEMLAFGMLSAEGERVTFSNPVDTGGVKGSVEKWLAQVEETMVGSLKNITTYAKDAYLHTSRSEWVLKWPGQVIISVSQIYWTYEVHKAITRSTAGIQTFLAKWVTHLDNTIDVVRSEIPKLSRVILGALVTTDVHARDILEELISKKVQSDTDFLWMAQLRYYFEDFQVVLRMINSHVNYGYEYVGNPSRLVITPLTDRCYRILIGAYHLNLNGALIGPASTGKSEIAKDLAKTIAKQCVVLNCSADLDYLTLGKFVKGLASAGAWVVFDDFNRIDPSVMSVIGQQLWTVQQAVASKMGHCNLDGKELSLNLECNAIITMNPGYAGRHELPENLKVLFRPASVMVPDFRLIGEIYLYSIGFTHGHSLSGKLATLCQQCFEQLSSQSHYDFGLRAIKSVLVATGVAKLKFPDIEEVRLVLKSIHDVFLPQLISQDITSFEGIVSDLFHGVKFLTPDLGPLVAALKVACETRGLQPTDYFIEKTLQIYKLILARHGLMIVGEPMCGKTSAYQCLAAALTEIKNSKTPGFIEKRVQYKIVNPKSITMGQLYGCFDPVSHEWVDGIVANTFREMASSNNDDRKWLVFDGPVDSVWIENMNSVLDDNKKLCLMSGEIIQMTPPMSIIFEQGDLCQASPSTVSRCGIVYLDPEQLGWRPLKDSYLSQLPPEFTDEMKDIMDELFEWLIPPCLTFIRTSSDSFVPTTELHQFQSFIRLYRSFLKGDSSKNAEDEQSMAWLQYSFMFCVVWSLGATLVQESREQFDAFYRSLLLGNNKDAPKPKSFKLTKNQMFPDKGSVFDYICDKKKENNPWILWIDIVDKEDLKIPSNANVTDLIIPTDETSRQTFFLKTYINNEIPLMFCGPTGTGKSAITRNYLMALPKDKFIPNVINFSARTTATETQGFIMSKLDRRTKGVFGPAGGKKCIVFVDDLAMPQKDAYGAQAPIELIRQWIDCGSWYDKKEAIALVDTFFVGAITRSPAGGGRNDITSRLLRHLSILAIDAFDDNTLKKIFTSIVDWHFAKEYESEIVKWTKPLISATMHVYKSCVSQFRPTPEKSHYIFNLRDFSRVVRGLLLIPPSHLPEPTKLMRLWVHEVYRVFHDRLVDEGDRQTFFSLASKAVEDNFERNIQTLLGHLPPDENAKLEDAHMQRLIFGDYMFPTAEMKIYDEVKELHSLPEVMESYLEDLNAESTHSEISLVLFQYAIEHISRISRVLKQDNGHALLVGIVGSGRRTLTKMAAFMAGYDLMQIEITLSYGIREWREDIKKVLKHAGNEGKPTVFLFADNQIKDESFIENINMILNTGDVPNLFEPLERGEIFGTMQRAAKAVGRTGIQTSRISLHNFFIERVRANLHVVLAMSPVGDAFRKRLRMFPSLVTCCTIDWFTEWPEEALQKVAQKFLSNLITDDDVRASCVFMCQTIHENIRVLSADFYDQLGRRNYVTPTSYLEFILTYKTLYVKKRDELTNKRQRFLDGLDKLAAAAALIVIMQGELTILKKELSAMAEETEKLMVKIEAETVEAEAAKEIIAAEEIIAQESAAVAQVIKEDCETDLAEALPALEAALNALDTLTVGDVAVVKSMKNPPMGVRLVCECICVMKGIKPKRKVDADGRPYEDYWAASIVMLSDMKFLDSLKEYDKDNIPWKVIVTIREKFIPSPAFDPAVIKNVSRACECIVRWVKAIEVYDRVNRIVKPKKIRLASAEAELAVLMERLNEKRRQLAEIIARLDKLNAEYAAMIKKKKELEENILVTSKKLERAKKIIDGLAGEKIRSEEGAKMLAIKLINLVGDALIGSAIIAYLGPFTVDFRQGYVDKWHHLTISHKIPCTPDFSLILTFGDPVEIRNWSVAGLPADTFSVDNGIIAMNCLRWPLMIDPQAEASKWIRKLEKERNLELVSLTDPKYMKVIEHAIKVGDPALLDNVGEELDPALEPVLLQNKFKRPAAAVPDEEEDDEEEEEEEEEEMKSKAKAKEKSKSKEGGEEVVCIKIGDSIVEYNDDFRFYIITRLRNPHYLPETAVKVTILNFMITPVGLQNQLLSIVVSKEEPELEERKNQLVLEGVQHQNQLKELEDKILDVLINSENILDDDEAVHIVFTSKELSAEIMAKQEAAAALEKKIDQARIRYRPIALHASTLFFCISDLSNIDPMYQYSLAWFINLYASSIMNSRPNKDLASRIHLVNEHFTFSIYRNVCHSLFDKDKLVFSFALCVALMTLKGDPIEKEALRFLLTGRTDGRKSGARASVSFSTKHYQNPAPAWLGDKSWAEIVVLSKLKQFSKFMSSVQKHLNYWKKLYDHPDPQEMRFPPPWDKIGDMERLSILHCFRPDKIVPGMRMFITKHLGKEFIEPPHFDLESSFSDSNSATPLVFILSPGTDPTLGLFKFAADKGFTGGKMHSISLGPGQGPVARKIIDEATTDGSWVVLQNCHLATSWMPVLEMICQDVITAEDTNPGFRLWLTSYPSPYFPVTVLQNSVKMTNEAPQGLRANLIKSYTGNPIADPNFFNSVKQNTVAWNRLLFGLCFFHAVVQERRKFGTLGWNNLYEFSEGDLRISLVQLQAMLSDEVAVPFEALTYLTVECNYGGRVTDDCDKRLLSSLLSIYYSKDIVDVESHSLSKSGLYRVPEDAGYTPALQYIRQLPLNPHPEVFGLHENSSIAKGKYETVQLLEGALLTQIEFKSGGGGHHIVDSTASEEVSEIVAEILSDFPADFNLDIVMEKFPVDYMNSMNTVLRQELVRFNGLTKVVRESLQHTEKAIKGLIAMSHDLEDVFNSFLNGSVPKAWKSKSYPSLKPLGSYITDLTQRLSFLQKWIDNGAPSVFWLAGFYFPQAFLTGMTQDFARKHKHPIDHLGFDFLVMDKNTEISPPKDGAFCRGLFLEGARWDNQKKQLTECFPKLLHDPLPVIWFRVVDKTKSSSKSGYDCPLYITSNRQGVLSTTGHSTNFIMYIKLRTDVPQHHWINRGTAALCQLDD